MKELALSSEQFKPQTFLSVISSAKNDMLTPEDFLGSANGYYEETTAKVFAAYQAQLRANNAVDFDDIMLLTVRLFREHGDVLERYQELFRYILVDLSLIHI